MWDYLVAHTNSIGFTQVHLDNTETLCLFSPSSTLKVFVVPGGCRVVGLTAWSTCILLKFTFREGNCVADYLANIGFGLHNYIWWNSSTGSNSRFVAWRRLESTKL
ncbi:hypothetical protein Dsin_028115 [Dipteronia sinensis]|uniref:Uncharacterized protein n=1 Tax=Dipteronia sinensis TaxID=43782 RepID=A0AAD9ZQ65_9ROSI|nr:hypothetical protein Dsin_028115 [Dipteronia sinensis]